MNNYGVKSMAVALTLTKMAGSSPLTLCSHLWLWQASDLWCEILDADY